VGDKRLQGARCWGPAGMSDAFDAVVRRSLAELTALSSTLAVAVCRQKRQRRAALPLMPERKLQSSSALPPLHHLHHLHHLHDLHHDLWRQVYMYLDGPSLACMMGVSNECRRRVDEWRRDHRSIDTASPPFRARVSVLAGDSRTQTRQRQDDDVAWRFAPEQLRRSRGCLFSHNTRVCFIGGKAPAEDATLRSQGRLRDTDLDCFYQWHDGYWQCLPLEGRAPREAFDVHPLSPNTLDASHIRVGYTKAQLRARTFYTFEPVTTTTALTSPPTGTTAVESGSDDTLTTTMLVRAQDSFDWVYILDIEARQWQRLPLAHSPAPLNGYATFAHRNTIYVHGGQTGLCKPLQSELWSVTLPQGIDLPRWEQLKTTGDSPPACGAHSATVLGDWVVFIGGTLDMLPHEHHHRHFVPVHALHLPSLKWSVVSTTSMTSTSTPGLLHHCAIAAGNRTVLLIGGAPHQRRMTGAVHALRLTLHTQQCSGVWSDVWLDAAPLCPRIESRGCCDSTGALLVMGGCRRQSRDAAQTVGYRVEDYLCDLVQMRVGS
jgi:hypothetical protein